MKLDAFLAKHPVFTVEEIDRFLGASHNPLTRKALLQYHLESGRLIHVRRGLYATVSPGHSAASFVVDPLLITSRLSTAAVLAYHTALQFHGVAQSVRNQFIALTHDRRSSSVNFRGGVYQSVAAPAPLRQSAGFDLGVESGDRSGLTVRVTGLERTLVDSLDRPLLAGGWEEIWRSFQDVGYLDVDLVTTCVLAYGNAALAAKVGYFLESNRNALRVDSSRLERLREYRPKQPRYLDLSARGGNFVSSWNLIVPISIVSESWRAAA
jgi:predicted transcriptional regulator of viral defense system